MTAAKTRPITFSDEMVRAILDGRKTQTRRAVTPQPECSHNGEPYWYVGGYRAWPYRRADITRSSANVIPCPYGRPGDLLWVRETHYRFGHWEPIEGARTKGGRHKWAFVADSDEVRFEPPYHYRMGRHHKDPATPAWHKRLARFMPRRLARTVLEVVSVRAEWLHDITEEDAMAEGCPLIDPSPFVRGYGAASASGWFSDLWERINGDGSWAQKPLVWVIGFRRVNG